MFISSKNITMLAIFDTNQDISLAEIDIKFTKCSNNTNAIVYSKHVFILFFECIIVGMRCTALFAVSNTFTAFFAVAVYEPNSFRFKIHEVDLHYLLSHSRSSCPFICTRMVHPREKRSSEKIQITLSGIHI